MLGRNRVVIVIGLVLAAMLALGALTAYAQGGPGGRGNGNTPCDFGQGMMGGRGMMNGRGMMGGNGFQGCAQGQGMMGGMMNQFGRGAGAGMMDAWTPPAELAPAGEAVTLEEATAIAEAYVAALESETPLALGDVVEFNGIFHGEAVEAESGDVALRFVIDPATGTVYGRGPYGVGLCSGLADCPWNQATDGAGE